MQKYFILILFKSIVRNRKQFCIHSRFTFISLQKYLSHYLRISIVRIYPYPWITCCLQRYTAPNVIALIRLLSVPRLPKL